MTAQAAGLDERVLMHSSRAPRADLSFSARTSHGEFSLLANSFKLTLLFLLFVMDGITSTPFLLLSLLSVTNLA